MGKLIPLLTAGTGAAAVSVGGFYLVDGIKGEEVGGDQPQPVPPSSKKPNPTLTQDFEFETIEAFKKDMKKSECVKNYFGDSMSDNPDAPKISNNAPGDSVFFKGTPTSTNPYKSCLTVERKVTKYTTDEKWSGKFTWLWAFVRGDEGVITFNVIETSDVESGKMKISGIFYLVGKNDDNWEIKHKHEPKSNIPDNSAQIDTYFPKAGDDLKKSVDGDYWGFVESADKWDKSCKTDECGSADSSGPTFVSKKLTWTNGTNKNKKLSGWSSSSTWWSNIYDSSSWNLSNKMDSFYGTWELDISQNK